MRCHSQSPLVSEVLQVLLLKSFYYSLPLFINFFFLGGESCAAFLKGLLINNFCSFCLQAEGGQGGGGVVTLVVVENRQKFKPLYHITLLLD